MLNSLIQNQLHMLKKLIKFFKKRIKANHLSKIYDIDHCEHGWFDTDLSWDEIVTKYGSYSNDNIVNSCINSLLKVKNNEYPYERDSVVFNKIEYCWPLVSFLLMIGSENNSQINVIDFGGSLGSSYFQNRQIFKYVKKVSWAVVEQKKFVENGNELFADQSLSFFYDLSSALQKTNSKSIIISSAIQYIENFEELIRQIINCDFSWIFIDRTGFSNQNDLKRLTIQKVPKQIYEAVYPCWFFNYEKFVELFAEKYDLFGEFESYCDKNITVNGKEKVNYKGLILKRKNEISDL